MSEEKYVVYGDWSDTEWQAIAAKRSNVELTPTELELLAKGPRTHPYGLASVVVVVDGEPRVYPSRDHAVQDGAVEPDEEKQEEVLPAPAPDESAHE